MIRTLSHAKMNEKSAQQLIKTSRKWATPLTAGSFIVLAVTGLLMFFHFDRGLNHFAHEWIGWVLLLGVLCHVTANFRAFKQHLSGRLGQVLLLVFIVILGLSFIRPVERDRGPGWAQPVKALGAMQFKDLAYVAHMTTAQVRERLKKANFEPTSDDQSIQELVGHNLKKQVRALSVIFPDQEQ